MKLAFYWVLHPFYVDKKCVHKALETPLSDSPTKNISEYFYLFSFTHSIILFLPTLKISSLFSIQIHFLPVLITATPVVMLPAHDSNIFRHPERQNSLTAAAPLFLSVLFSMLKL